MTQSSNLFSAKSPTEVLLRVMNTIEKNYLEDRLNLITPEQETIIFNALRDGANPAITTSGPKNTVLLLAILCGREEFVKGLIKAMKNPVILNQADELRFAKNTPLILAIKRGMYDAAALLIKKGVDLDACSDSHLTALHYACGLLGIDTDEKNLKLLRLIHKLLDYGADTKKESIDGKVPLDLLNDKITHASFNLRELNSTHRIAKMYALSPEEVMEWQSGKHNPKYNVLDQALARYQSFKEQYAKADAQQQFALRKKYHHEVQAFDDYHSQYYTIHSLVSSKMLGIDFGTIDHIDWATLNSVTHPPAIIVAKNVPFESAMMMVYEDMGWHRNFGKTNMNVRCCALRARFFHDYPSEINTLREHFKKPKSHHINTAP